MVRVFALQKAGLCHAGPKAALTIISGPLPLRGKGSPQQEMGQLEQEDGYPSFS